MCEDIECCVTLPEEFSAHQYNKHCEKKLQIYNWLKAIHNTIRTYNIIYNWLKAIHNTIRTYNIIYNWLKAILNTIRTYNIIYNWLKAIHNTIRTYNIIRSFVHQQNSYPCILIQLYVISQQVIWTTNIDLLPGRRINKAEVKSVGTRIN